MAKVLKWQEKLILAFAALLFSMASGFGLGPRDSATANRSSSSRMVTVGKSGVELMARKPYLRLVHAPLAPVSLPLATGAYVVIASAATPAADAASSCSSGTKGDGGTTGHGCWTVYCSGSFEHQPQGQHTCVTCGYGTCGVCC